MEDYVYQSNSQLRCLSASMRISQLNLITGWTFRYMNSLFMYKALENRLPSILLLSFLALLSLVSTTFSQSVYQYDIVVKTGDNLQDVGTVIGLGKGPSINDTGKIGYTAQLYSGNSAVIVQNKEKEEIEKKFIIGSPYNGGNEVQLNNNDQVVWYERSKDGLITFIKRLDSEPGGVFIGSGSLSPRWEGIFNVVYPRASLNNNEGVVFSADLKSGGTVLAFEDDTFGPGPDTQSAHTENYQELIPMVSDDGKTVVRWANNSYYDLRVFSDTTFSSLAFEIAKPPEYIQIGARPAISDDGRVIAFMGEHSTKGTGIFYAIVDPLSSLSPKYKLISIPASSNLDRRLGINHPAGGTLNEYKIVYLADNTAGGLGLHVIDIDISNPNNPDASNHVLLAEQGSSFGNFIITVQDIDIYDPVNNCGQIVFWIKTLAGSQAIIRASSDRDGDALCDCWEIEGIKDAEDNIILNLPAMGADPDIKDIFVEVDYMGLASDNSHDHKPRKKAIDKVISAFFNSPVDCKSDDPKDCKGIRLHVDYGPETVMNPETANPVLGEVWGDRSESTELPHDINFGDVGEEKPNIIKAFIDMKRGITKGKLNFLPERLPAFHYVIFAHNRYKDDKGGGTIADTGAGRFLRDSFITLSREASSKLKGLVDDEAGTFMHETGHRLGLNHGGAANDEINYKPNYLSVMNYHFQKYGLIINQMHDNHPGSSFPDATAGFF